MKQGTTSKESRHPTCEQSYVRDKSKETDCNTLAYRKGKKSNELVFGNNSRLTPISKFKNQRNAESLKLIGNLQTTMCDLQTLIPHRGDAAM